MPGKKPSLWVRFWHEPVRAERLAAVRIALGLALLGDQLLQYVPIFSDLFGPDGVAYAGLTDEDQTYGWYWTILFFRTDNLTVLRCAFAVWVALTLAFIAGWRTRLTNVALWLLTMCFCNRTYSVLNGGDDVLQGALFLLMFMPSGRALSLDWLRERRRRRRAGLPMGELDRPLIAPWGVRLIQLQTCMMYLATGTAKLRGWPTTWMQGLSIHYVLNDCTMARIAFAQLVLPIWVTAPATWVSVGWETLFPLLVANRWTRRWALWYGVLFHLGIYALIEVGWFSFYTLALYPVWISDRFWDRWLSPVAPKAEGDPAQQSSADAIEKETSPPATARQPEETVTGS